MNELQVFNNPEFGEIRSLLIESEPWFVGKDVSTALGYTNTRDALRNHVDKEDKNTIANHDGNKGNPNMTIINESGLYSLIFSSKLESAKKFKRWVTAEVLPQIRKTGSYGINECVAEKNTNTTGNETLTHCAEIMASCTDDNRPYVLAILQRVIPDIKQYNSCDRRIETKPARKCMSHEGFDIPFDYEKFDRVMKARRISNHKFASRINSYAESISKWRRGVCAPCTENRNRICDALNLPRSYFNRPQELESPEDSLIGNTTTPENEQAARFAAFWNAYPNKKAKIYAKEAWMNLHPDDALFEKIMQAVEIQKRSYDWARENGRFIPYPAKWLNDGYWDDEVKDVSE